ncbi:MAG: hypothetical protein NT006_06310 [Candidatus Aminicenantes bacterium]|nr:hypothetical protein [Candidatus Aminicenantes bacterium]
MNQQLTGAAGVFHVASELSMAGWVALPSIRNVKGADIFVADPDGKRFVFLQVKTSKSKVTFWPIGEGARKWKGRNCYYAFVRRVGDRFEVFLEKAAVVAREVDTADRMTRERGCKQWALAWPLTGGYATKGAAERTRRQWKAFMKGPK